MSVESERVNSSLGSRQPLTAACVHGSRPSGTTAERGVYPFAFWLATGYGGNQPSPQTGQFPDATVQGIDCLRGPSVCYHRDMPVTAKLSREFYDRFGDKVVDELVGLRTIWTRLSAPSCGS